MGGVQCVQCTRHSTTTVHDFEVPEGLIDIIGDMFEASMTDSQMLNVFAQVDTNKDGYLDDNEIYDALQKMGYLTIDLATISSCMPHSKMGFEEIKQIVRRTHEEMLRVRATIRNTLLRRITPALLQMGSKCIEQYGCDDLTDVSLKRRYEQMILEGYGLPAQKVAQRTGSRAQQKNCFADFKRAVCAAVNMKLVESIEQRLAIHPTGEVIVLGTREIPESFGSRLVDLEEKMDVAPIKFAIYQSGPDVWCIHAVSVKGHREPRQLFPMQWRGLVDDHLRDASGIPGSIAVLGNGCVATCKSQSAAIALSAKALQWGGKSIVSC